jgi:hypothetical protein
VLRHFIGYHNREGMGYPANDRDPLSIHTNQPVQQMLNETVWIIEGQGTEGRKRFTLAAVFIVREVGESDLKGFVNVARGAGHVFQTPPVLNELAWFPDFFEWAGRFGRGVPELADRQFIDELIRLLIVSE